MEEKPKACNATKVFRQRGSGNVNWATGKGAKMADLKKKWGKYIPQSKILARWAEPEELKKFNFKKLPSKMAAIWGLEGPVKNWPHEAQFLLVALVKLASNEADLIRAAKKLDFRVVGAEIKKNKSFLGAAIKTVPQERVKKFMEGRIQFSRLFKNNLGAEVEEVFKKYGKVDEWYHFADACKLWKERKLFQHFHFSGKAAGIQYEILETAEALVLDYASDCCQGFGSAGESCMISGIKSPDQGFLTFREKGKIFAQGWFGYLKEERVLVIDSLEFKGSWRKSLETAFRAVLQELKERGIKAVVVGRSPNRHDFNGAVKAITNASLKNKRARKIAKSIDKVVEDRWIKPILDNDIYTDMTEGYYTIIL